jgi:hypothetical protein
MTECPDIPEEFYGKWAPYVKEMREKNKNAEGSFIPKNPDTVETLETLMEKVSMIEAEDIPDPLAALVVTQTYRPKASKNSGSVDPFTNISLIKTEVPNLMEDIMDVKLSKLRSQGLVISNSAFPKNPSPEGESCLGTTSTGNKTRYAPDSSRGHGHRKTSTTAPIQ